MRRLLLHFAGLIAVAVTGEALPNASFSETTDLLVVPGQRIGGLELGMKREKIRDVLGRAGSEYPTAHKRVEEVWFYDKDGRAEGQIEVQFANDVAVSIGTSLPRSASNDGVVHGSTIAGLNTRNAPLRMTTYFVYRSGGVDVKCFDDVRAGIVFEFSKATDAPEYTLSDFWVHARGTPGTCSRDGDPRASVKRRTTVAPGAAK
jgi:hypothetical protein